MSADKPRPRGQKDIIAFAESLKSLREFFPRPCAVLACDVMRYGLSMKLSGWAAARGAAVRAFRDITEASVVLDSWRDEYNNAGPIAT